jgi:hypothetical protein
MCAIPRIHLALVGRRCRAAHASRNEHSDVPVTAWTVDLALNALDGNWECAAVHPYRQNDFL